MHIYYRWQVTTLPQERYYTSIAIAAFLCLAVAATFVQDLLGRDHALARIGALTSAPAPPRGSPGASWSSEVTTPSA